MNDQVFLEKLLDGAEVEWLPLKEVVITVTAPAKLKKNSYADTGAIPIIDQGASFITGYTDGAFKALPEDEYVIFGDHSEHIKYVDFSFIQGADGLKILKPKLDNARYIYHAFLNFYQKELNYKRHWSKAKETLIPMPCPDDPEKSLRIQGEIVRILDSFTQLTAELTAELTARRQQYNHYRDQLLSFDEDEVDWKTLGEVAADFGRGKSKHRPRNDPNLYGGKMPFIQTGEIRNSAHEIINFKQTYSELGLQQSKLWPKGTLCITIAANIAETAILGFDACFPDSIIGFVEDPKKSNAQYVEYLLSSLKANLQAEGKKNSSAQSNINLETFKKTRFPFPSTPEQARIVAILDKFDTLTTSLSEGLPREIKLHQQQYEYYRGLLLSFPKPDEMA